jgi:hypothetical protein
MWLDGRHVRQAVALHDGCAVVEKDVIDSGTVKINVGGCRQSRMQFVPGDLNTQVWCFTVGAATLGSEGWQERYIAWDALFAVLIR